MTTIVKSSISSIQMTTYAELHLAKGAKVRVQSYALRTWSDGIEVYPETLSGKVKDDMKLMHESVGFEICEAKEDGWIQISKERPATIIELDSEEIYSTLTSYICSEADVIPVPFSVTDEYSRKCESGKFWEYFKNPNRQKIYLEFDGGLIEKILQPGETMNIRQGFWFAMEGGVSMKTTMAGVRVKNKSDAPKKVFVKSYKERW